MTAGYSLDDGVMKEKMFELSELSCDFNIDFDLSYSASLGSRTKIVSFF